MCLGTIFQNKINSVVKDLSFAWNQFFLIVLGILNEEERNILNRISKEQFYFKKPIWIIVSKALIDFYRW